MLLSGAVAGWSGVKSPPVTILEPSLSLFKSESPSIFPFLSNTSPSLLIFSPVDTFSITSFSPTLPTIVLSSVRVSSSDGLCVSSSDGFFVLSSDGVFVSSLGVGVVSPDGLVEVPLPPVTPVGVVPVGLTPPPPKVSPSSKLSSWL